MKDYTTVADVAAVSDSTPRLVDYNTTEVIRAATQAEEDASQRAAERDGGAGVILVDGRSCYVEE